MRVSSPLVFELSNRNALFLICCQRNNLSNQLSALSDLLNSCGYADLEGLGIALAPGLDDDDEVPALAQPLLLHEHLTP